MSAKTAFPIYPLWWDFPPKFYRRLANMAQKADCTEVEVLINLVNRAGRTKAVKNVHPNWKGPKDLAKLRWAKTTPEERSAVGKNMARIRWDRKVKIDQ